MDRHDTNGHDHVHAPVSPSGFSLVELILVIALLGVLATLFFVEVSGTSDASKHAQTQALLQSLREAIIGDNTVDANGHRTHFGYLGDMGGVPSTLVDLTTQGVQPAWTLDTTKGVGAGWRGPYIAPVFTNGLSVTLDAWGRSLVYSAAPEPVSITSYGADGVAGGTGFNTDIVVQIPAALRYGTVNGIAHDGDLMLTSASVSLWRPVGGTLTLATTTSNASDGSFSFNNIPFGLRALSVTSGTTTVGPNRFLIDSSPYQLPNDSLDSLGKSAVTNGAVTLSGSNKNVDVPLTSTYPAQMTLGYLTARWQNSATLTQIVFTTGATVQTQNVPNVPSGTRVALSTALTIPANGSATTMSLHFSSTMGSQNFTVTLEWNGAGNHDTLVFSTPSAGTPAPTISSIDPPYANYRGGGSAITINGANFVSGATVDIGGVACGSVTFVSAAKLTCVPGAHAVGHVTLTVTNPDAQTGTASFMYSVFVYVANKSATTISGFALDPTSGALTEFTNSPYSVGGSPVWLALTSDGQFLYTAYNAILTGTARGFSIDNTTGDLTSVTTANTVLTPNYVGIVGGNQYLYVTGTGLLVNKIYAYSINAGTGALTSVANYNTDTTPWGLASSDGDTRLYVAANGATKVDGFNIGGGGALTVQGFSPWATSSANPVGVLGHPTLLFIFVAEEGGDKIQTFSVNNGNGKLTSVGTYATNDKPDYLAMDSTNTYMYVSCSNASKLDGFSVGGTGALTALASSPYTTGTGPEGLAIDPTNTFLAVANKTSDNVSVFSFDAATGALTAVAGSPFTAGNGAYGLVMD